MDYRDSPIVNFAQLATDSSGSRVEGKKYQCSHSKLSRKGKIKREEEKQKPRHPRRVFQPKEKREEELKQVKHL